MRYLIRVTAAVGAVLAALASADASVLVTIDKSQQNMSVAVDGATRYSWPVSTARAGYTTPNGTYRPQLLARTWFSRKYYNSPMPYSIFFHGGYAIHGSYEISRLGGPASHGCVRLHPSNAATLFALVKSEGTGNTRIVVTGSSSRVVSAPARERSPEITPDRRFDYGPSANPYGGYDRGTMWWQNR
jgi:L,D-transpeptidase catalytic domain